MAILERISLLSHLPNISAASIARGTYSDAVPYSGFNACHYVGDSRAHVAECRSQLCDWLGITPDCLIVPRQTHSSRVAVIGDTPPDLEETDALVTRRRGIALCINTADCVPVVLADPAAGVIGAVHSGWRGTIASIVSNTVAKMVELGARTEKIHAAMGPCICGECYEVGEEVAGQFTQKYGNESGAVVIRNNRVYVNLALAVSLTLKEAGVKEINIALPTQCSHHTDGRWPSARNLGIASSRTLTLIILR